MTRWCWCWTTPAPSPRDGRLRRPHRRDGTPIYPYQNGKLEYYESTKITAKATGPVERVSLLDYGDVKAGQLLVQLGAKDTDEEIASKENALKRPGEAGGGHQGAGEVQRRRPH